MHPHVHCSAIYRKPHCPLMDEWIKKMWYTHKEILFSHKENEVLPFVTTRMNPEGHMVKRNMLDTDKAIWSHLHVESETKKAKNPRAHRNKEQTGGCQMLRGRSNGMGKRGEGSQKVWTPGIKYIRHGDVTYGMATIFTNTALHILKSLRE